MRGDNHAEDGGLALIAIIAAALFIPWNTRLHVTWVAACFAIDGALYIAAAAFTDANLFDRGQLGFFFTTGTAAALSIAGHLITRRQRLTNLERGMQVLNLHNQLAGEAVSLALPGQAAGALSGTAGIGSRLALEQALGRMQRSTDRDGAVIMLDVDRFKLYNDHQQDHVNGDRALGAVGQALASNLRGSDQVFRFGESECRHRVTA